MLDIYRAEVSRQGGLLGPVAAYEPRATAFGAEVAELAKGRFDALFVADSARQLSLIAPALAAGGLWSTPRGGEAPKGGKAITLLAPSVAFEPRLPQTVGRYLQGALFSSPFDATTATGSALSFATRFSEQFGSQPDTFAAFSHDSYRLIRAAVDAGAVSRESLSEELIQVRPDELAGAGAGFASDRQALRPTRLLTLDGEAFVPATAAARPGS